MNSPFNATYFSTAAQVIPVFLLAVLGLAFNLDRHLKRPALAGVSLWAIAYVGLAVFAEVTCLQALSRQEAPSEVERGLIQASLIVPGGAIGGAVVAWNWNYLRGSLPCRAARRIFLAVAGAWIVGVLLASANGWDQDKIFSWGITSILLGLVLYGMHLMRQTSSGEPATDSPPAASAKKRGCAPPRSSGPSSQWETRSPVARWPALQSGTSSDDQEPGRVGRSISHPRAQTRRSRFPLKRPVPALWKLLYIRRVGRGN